MVGGFEPIKVTTMSQNIEQNIDTKDVIADLEEFNKLLHQANEFIDTDFEESEEAKQKRLEEEKLRKEQELKSVNDIEGKLDEKLKASVEKISDRHYVLLDKYHARIYDFFSKLKEKEDQELNSETRFLEDILDTAPIINEN